jgi:signal transduction histidine kinase
MASGAPAATSPSFLPEGLLLDLLAISLTGVNVLRPVYNATGEVVDFALEYLNPVGQRMTGLAERPSSTLLTRFPHALAAGIFSYYLRVYEAGATDSYKVYYQAEGFDNYFQLAACRSGNLLVVSFTDTSEQDRTAVEEALHVAQATEQAARAAAEHQRGELERVFEQAPVAIAVYRGPTYTIELANPTVARLWGRTREQLLGKGLFEALPEVAGLGYEQLLDEVMATGIPHVAQAMEAQHEREGRLDTVYWDFVYVPMRAADGATNGVMVVATEVTAQVLARRQAEQLTQELEARVQARTRELADQQRLLDQILAQVPAAITTLRGPDHRFTFANERYQQLVEGRVRVGQTVAETLPEVAEQGFIELLDNVYHTSQTFEGKEIAILLAPSGGVPVQHYLDFTYQPMLDEHGQTQGLLVFAVDVTESVRTRRQADTMQAALLAAAQHRAQERQDLLALFEQAPVAIALLREPDHRLDYTNALFEQLFPSTQGRGRPAAEVYLDPAMTQVLGRLDSVYQSGEQYQSGETRLPTALPQAPRYVTFACQAYYEQGRVAGVAVFVHEVTEQVLARQQREAQQQLVETVFEQSPVAIAIMRGPELRVELANPAVAAIWGRDPAQVLGRPYFEAMPDTAGQGFEQILADVLTTRQPFTITEAPVRLARAHKGLPTQAFVNFIFQALPDATGQPVGLIASGIEVTEQVLARQQIEQSRRQVEALNQELAASNEQLQELNRQLTRTNVDLDTFVYTASHDLKAPITDVEGLLKALGETLPPPVLQEVEVAQLLRLLDRTVSRFLTTIDQLADLARLQRLYDEPAEPVAMAPVVAEVLQDLAPAIRTAAAQVQVEVPAALHVAFTSAGLRSVVYNLLSNAVKYSDPGRLVQVWVRATVQPGVVVLTVRDNGLGLTDAQQQRLFGAFQRLHTHVAGTGVGLYMIKRLIENADGTITVQSQPNVGTTFTVTLPSQAPLDVTIA